MSDTTKDPGWRFYLPVEVRFAGDSRPVERLCDLAHLVALRRQWHPRANLVRRTLDGDAHDAVRLAERPAKLNAIASANLARTLT